MSSLLIFTGLISVAIWVYLVFARGKFWHVQQFDDDRAQRALLPNWPRVTAIVPARNEAHTIAQTVASLLQQNYAGQLSVLVVDDHSEDGTAAAALQASRDSAAESRVRVHAASILPPGWTGKLWALNDGVASITAEAPEFYWLTDADIVHASDTLERLVSRAGQEHLDLTSLMVLLRTQTLAERVLIPPFLFFFLKLYPPPWTANEKSRTAGAAGGCILLRREALERAGGFAAIRGEVIDDCALARVVKHSGGRIWMGVTRASVSLRSYQNAAEIRDMIARTAFTQLRYSALFLFGAIVAMFLMYFAPIALLFAHNSLAVALGLLAWLLITASFLPIVRFYRLSILWAPLLPFVALFYTYSMLLSAMRFWLGRGAQWKGRAQAPRAA